MDEGSRQVTRDSTIFSEFAVGRGNHSASSSSVGGAGGLIWALVCIFSLETRTCVTPFMLPFTKKKFFPALVSKSHPRGILDLATECCTSINEVQ